MVDYLLSKELERFGCGDVDSFIRKYWSLVPYEKRKGLEDMGFN